MSNARNLRTLLLGGVAVVVVVLMALLAFGKLGNGSQQPVVLRGLIVAQGKPYANSTVQLSAVPATQSSGLAPLPIGQLVTKSDGTFEFRYGVPSQSGYMRTGNTLELVVQATYGSTPRVFEMLVKYTGGHWVNNASPHSDPPYLWMDVYTKTAKYTAP